MSRWPLPTLDDLLRMPWTIRGPRHVVESQEAGGNEWWEIRVEELPDFFVADVNREQVLAEYLPALSTFFESYTNRGELPPLPRETLWNWLAMMVRPATNGSTRTVSLMQVQADQRDGAMNPTEQQRAEWDAWLATRPAIVREVAEKFPPWSYYRLPSTNQLGQILAYGEDEDGTVTVRMLLCLEGAGRLATLMTREVFGIDPGELEPTDREPDYVMQSKQTEGPR